MCIYISSKGFYIDQRISTKFGIFFDILKEKKKKKKNTAEVSTPLSSLTQFISS